MGGEGARQGGLGGEAHLGGRRACAARICAPWQSWRSRSWFGQHYHAHSLQRRRPRSSPARGRLPGLPCRCSHHSLPTLTPTTSPGQGREGHSWHSPASPDPQAQQGPVQVGAESKREGCPPVEVQGAAVLGLADVLEEFRALVLQHGISQHLREGVLVLAEALPQPQALGYSEPRMPFSPWPG